MTSIAPTPAWRLRLGAAFMLAGLVWFVPWLLLNLNGDLAWFAIPYAIAHLVIAANLVVTAANNWTRKHPPLRLLTEDEPLVGVLIPTAGEPTWMVERTLRSVLEQDWPIERLRIVVSDDAHRPEIAAMVRAVGSDIHGAAIAYHEPEPRHSRGRGDGKAGNLNSALARLESDVHFIETRDSDDEVGDPRFLRHCLGQLEADDQLAFVQTIKTAQVSPGDPFNNLESIFYNEVMPAKHAANAVFPCGSGVVWRRSALREIGDFPTWNLVEDVQSGVEALRRGWRGAYVPIVGARAQHAPEDIPNFYKQRGTWAIDTIRLLVWGDLSGLSFRQRLQFAEMAIFYLQGFIIWTLALMGVAWLVLDLAPLASDAVEYTIHFVPFAIGLELFFFFWKGQQPYRALWQARELGTGLAPVFTRAVLVALAGGRSRKPMYRVTRKRNAFSIYLWEVAPHIAALMIVSCGFLYGLLVRQNPYALSLPTLYWLIVFVILLGRFVRKGWFGVRLPVRSRLVHATDGRHRGGRGLAG